MAVSASMPRIVLAVTVLPDPDSPTMASTSAGATVSETSSTALTSPESVAQVTFRCAMLRTVSLGAGPGLSDDGQHLGGRHSQRDVVDGLDIAGIGGEGDLQVLDAQDRLPGSRRCGQISAIVELPELVRGVAHAVTLSWTVLSPAGASGCGVLPARRRLRSRGSLRSFMLSPTRVRPSTASTIAMPGKTPVHQMPAVVSESAWFRS